MTLKEALRSVVNYPLTDMSLDKALIDGKLDPTATYDISYKKDIDLVAAELILIIVGSPDISEGGYSVSIGDREMLLKLRRELRAKHGLGGISSGKFW